MTIEVTYLPEPKLQFGSYFEHEDTKTGLAEFGPFGKAVAGLHPSEIKLGFVGTRETVSGAREWVEECGSAIESENTKIIPGKVTKVADTGLFQSAGEPPPPPAPSITRMMKILNRDFIGFSRESQFGCCFQTNARWERILQSLELKRLLEIEDKRKRIEEVVKLLEDEVRSLAQTKPAPDIIILALTQEMIDQAHSVRVAGNFYYNLRRAIKAQAMRWGVPIQILQQSTVLGKKSPGRQLQEKATRAWNFCTALYYKAEGVPWRPLSFEQEACFVGIDFYVARQEKGRLTLRSSPSISEDCQ